MEGRYINLSTYRKSGVPVDTPVWFAEDSGRLPLLPGSGGASPVVAGGNVFVYYLVPSGEAVDEALLRQRREKAKGKPMPRWEPDLWRIAADDVVACIDGRSGQTRWRTVYRGAGANWHDSKAGPCNVTPCIANSRIYAIGSTGRVYCGYSSNLP